MMIVIIIKIIIIIIIIVGKEPAGETNLSEKWWRREPFKLKLWRLFLVTKRLETMPNTRYSAWDVRILRTVNTYEVVGQPENAHGYDGWGNVRDKARESLAVLPLHRTSTLPDITQLWRYFSSRFCKTWTLYTRCHLGTRHWKRRQCTRRTMRKRSGMSLYLQGIKKVTANRLNNIKTTNYNQI